MDIMKWRAEEALKERGVEDFGPALVALAASVLEGIDELGPSLDDDDVMALVAERVGPGRICPPCLFMLISESPELLFGESDAAAQAESVMDAMALTIFKLVWQIATSTAERHREVNAPAS